MTTSQTTRLGKFDLTNRWALVTGAAGLLGLEHSRALLEVGACVVLLDNNSDKLDQAKAALESDYPKNRIRVS